MSHQGELYGRSARAGTADRVGVAPALRGWRINRDALGARTGRRRRRPVRAQVEVLRTAYGVPHIYADTFEALGYALGYLQVEDYGERARGELALDEGRAALDADFGSQPYYRRAVEVYPELQQDTRDVYDGFAAGVNRYLAQHPEEFAGWVADPFTGYDVAALAVSRSSASQTRRWINRLTGAPDAPLLDIERDDAAADGDPLEAGSSAWALAPSRTTSGAAILLRNPHQSWDAGYWEAHAVVPDRLDFYGDFRIGAPLGIVGGFNPYLGFATTNNDVDNGQVYALAIDPTRLDHYMLDGVSVPLGRELVTRRFRNGDGYGFETRERMFTDLGSVIHRDHGRIYILRTPEDGEFRGGEQFLRMMQATTLDEWTDAMRLRAFPRSNFTYADGDGNVFYLWNAAMPVFPHTYDDTRAVPVTRRSQIWSALHELNELPQVLNPPGGADPRPRDSYLAPAQHDFAGHRARAGRGPRGLMRIPRTAPRRAILLQHRVEHAEARADHQLEEFGFRVDQEFNERQGPDGGRFSSNDRTGYARLLHSGSLLAGLRPRLVTTRVPRAVRSRCSQISTVSGTSPPRARSVDPESRRA